MQLVDLVTVPGKWHTYQKMALPKALTFSLRVVGSVTKRRSYRWPGPAVSRVAARYFYPTSLKYTKSLFCSPAIYVTSMLQSPSAHV